MATTLKRKEKKKMHSFGNRFNTLITLAVLLLAVLCMLSSFTDKFNSSSIDAHVEGLKLVRFRKQLNGNDEASFTLNISLDLRSTFTWNTKQKHHHDDNFLKRAELLNLNSKSDVFIIHPFHESVIMEVFVFVTAEYETEKDTFNQISLWDHIIEDKDLAKLQTQTITKYLLIDQGSNLRGRKINLVLHWYIMPKIGRIVEGRMMMSNFYLPEVYT